MLLQSMSSWHCLQNNIECRLLDLVTYEFRVSQFISENQDDDSNRQRWSYTMEACSNIGCTFIVVAIHRSTGHGGRERFRSTLQKVKSKKMDVNESHWILKVWITKKFGSISINNMMSLTAVGAWWAFPFMLIHLYISTFMLISFLSGNLLCITRAWCILLLFHFI